MWASVHGLYPLRWWAIPFWITIISGVSLFFTIPKDLWIWSASIGGLAFFVLFISFLLVSPYKVWKQDMDDLLPLKQLREEQCGNEQRYLHLGSTVDFGLGGKQISIQFRIYSGLVYDFCLSRMWVTLNLGNYRPEKRLHEIIPAPKLFRSSCNEFGTMRIIIDDDELIRRIEVIRSSQAIEKELRVEMQPLDSTKLLMVKESF